MYYRCEIILNNFTKMAEAAKKSPKEASGIFHNIRKHPYQVILNLKSNQRNKDLLRNNA